MKQEELTMPEFSFYRAGELIGAFAYHFFGVCPFNPYPENIRHRDYRDSLIAAFCQVFTDEKEARARADRVISSAESITAVLRLDAESIYLADPAAESPSEVIACYPGFFAILCHRLAHEIYLEGARLIARFISEYAHSVTGIDIHPGATIGESFSIDHGTGVVIGETALIGRGVKIYQGVTIGAKSFPRDENGNFDKTKKRHPTVCDGCTVYAGATILGGDTVIGEGSVIGANVWLTSSVAPGSVIYYGGKK